MKDITKPERPVKKLLILIYIYVSLLIFSYELRNYKNNISYTYIFCITSHV